VQHRLFWTLGARSNVGSVPMQYRYNIRIIILFWLSLVLRIVSTSKWIPAYIILYFRIAVLKKWREKYHSRATYRNLAYLFYQAGKPILAECVFNTMTRNPPDNCLQPPSQRRQQTSTTHTSKCCVIMYCTTLLLGILLIPFSSQSDNFLNQMISASIDGDKTFRSELGKPVYSHNSHKVHQFAENNLPDFPGHFVGRDEDVSNITHLLLHSRVKFVHIFGFPAVGKSALAFHVGKEMASRGVTVQYINVDESHIFRSFDEPVPSHFSRSKATESRAISKTFRGITLSQYSQTRKKFVTTTAQDLLEWAKGLSSNTLLILDNCDSLLLEKKGKRNESLRVFDALNKASPYLHVVTTSRQKLTLLDIKAYKLKPLNNESAIELLHLISPTMKLNDSRKINELLDGIPLALKIVGSLVSEIRTPQLIIRDLEKNLIDTLTPEDVHLDMHKIRPVLRLSYNYLSASTQTCALYLSHFPGSSSENATLHILSRCTISNPTECLRNLTDVSLLDQYSYAGITRYQFHKLIREYVIEVESKYPRIETSIIAFRFNSSFLLHYAQMLSHFVSVYNEVPYDGENILRFKYESHNIECLFEKLHFNGWTVEKVTSVVSITHVLACDLMLEILTGRELLKIGQRILLMFEGQMNYISTNIGAYKTLNVYHDLVFTLKRWIKSFPETNCRALCEETFLQRGFMDRFKIIDEQLAKTTYYNRNNFYRNLQIPFFEESICFSYCLHFKTFDFHTILKYNFAMLVIVILKTVIGRSTVESLLGLLIQEFWLLLGLFFDVSVVVALYIVTCVGQNPNGLPLIRMIKQNQSNCKVNLTYLYLNVFWGLLMYAFRENMIVTNFFFLCIITNIASLFHTDIRITVLHIVSLAFLFNTYIFEFEIVHYASSYILTLWYHYQEYIDLFINKQFYFSLLLSLRH